MNYLGQLRNEREHLIFLWGYLISFSSRLKLIVGCGSPNNRALEEGDRELDEIIANVGAVLGRVESAVTERKSND